MPSTQWLFFKQYHLGNNDKDKDFCLCSVQLGIIFRYFLLSVLNGVIPFLSVLIDNFVICLFIWENASKILDEFEKILDEFEKQELSTYPVEMKMFVLPSYFLLIPLPPVSCGG